MRTVVPDDVPSVYQDYPEQLDRLRDLGAVVLHTTRAAHEDELIERLRDAEFAINVRAYSTFNDRVIAALPALRLISVLGTGTDNFDVSACTRQGVVVTNCPGASTASVAEMTIALMLAAARHIPVADRGVRQGAWVHSRSIELKGKVLGIVGLGLIGQEVARIARAFGMRVLAWSFREDRDRAARLGVEMVSLEELLTTSAIVSIHLRNSAEAKRIISRDRLGLMRSDAILINTARAALIDEDALLDALRARRIGGAGLDVFATEPLPAGSPWLELDNVVLTPHAAAATVEASARLAKTPVDNILNYLAGEPTSVVNPEALHHDRHQLAGFARSSGRQATG